MNGNSLVSNYGLCITTNYYYNKMHVITSVENIDRFIGHKWNPY